MTLFDYGVRVTPVLSVIILVATGMVERRAYDRLVHSLQAEVAAVQALGDQKARLAYECGFARAANIMPPPSLMAVCQRYERPEQSL